MKSFIDFVAKFKEYITLTALIVICFSSISLGNKFQLGGFRTVIVGSVGWLQSVIDWVPNPVALKSENRAVRELNLYLSSELIRSRKSIIENEKLKNMLSLRDTTKMELLPADVIGETIVELRKYVTINKGIDDGIAEGMAARTDAGLVGWIVAVNKNYSLIELINNSNVKVSTKIQRNSINGIIEWKGDKEFNMINVPDSYDMKVGDILLTSNYSNKYPADIPVGRITVAEHKVGSLFKIVKIAPLVDFSSLEQVFVISYLPNPERMGLIKEMEAKLKTRKSK
jgi:rod shape-determining protein MreC